MTTSTTPPPARRRLPITLVVLAALMLLKALLLVALVAGATLTYFQPLVLDGQVGDWLVVLAAAPLVSAGLLVCAGLVILSVIGLLLRRRGGWLLAMVMTGLFIAVDIYNFLNGGANHFWMLLGIVSVFYLNQQEVREVVGAATSLHPDGAPADGTQP